MWQITLSTATTRNPDASHLWYAPVACLYPGSPTEHPKAVSPWDFGAVFAEWDELDRCDLDYALLHGFNPRNHLPWTGPPIFKHLEAGTFPASGETVPIFNRNAGKSTR